MFHERGIRSRSMGVKPISQGHRIFARRYPVSLEAWGGTTIDLLSNSPDSSAKPEPPTASSPLHRVSREGLRNARGKGIKPETSTAFGLRVSCLPPRGRQLNFIGSEGTIEIMVERYRLS